MTPNIIPNMLAGNTGAVSQIQSTAGVPPVGNAGGSNIPNAGPVPLGVPNATPGSLTNSPLNPIFQAPAGSGVVPGLQAPNSFSGAIGNPGNVTQAAQHQLNNVYGQGVGGQIGALEANLGSGDSTYLQAYQNSIAQPNAENLATLNTTLGNSGVGANSSTAAIANADFEVGVSNQEGLQEQQLQQNNVQDLLGLVQGTEGAANKEASTSVLGDIGSVLGAIGQDAAAVAPALI